MAEYKRGNVTVVPGRTTVEGAGASWLSYINPGDLLTVDGISETILSITDNDTLELAAAWAGPVRENWEYSITRLPSLTDAKRKKWNEINAERMRREALPILCSGILVQADSEAIKNINGKLQGLTARDAVGRPISTSLLFWNDANNTVHTWNNEATYRAWLHELTVDIEERATLLYSTAWAKKAEVDALTTIEEIEQYNETVNWP